MIKFIASYDRSNPTSHRMQSNTAYLTYRPITITTAIILMNVIIMVIFIISCTQASPGLSLRVCTYRRDVILRFGIFIYFIYIFINTDTHSNKQ